MKKTRRFFYLKRNKTKKNPYFSLPIGCNFPMSSCLTEIFLSTASAERCKINFGKAWVEMIWLPENRAELGERGNFPASAGQLTFLYAFKEEKWLFLLSVEGPIPTVGVVASLGPPPEVQSRAASVTDTPSWPDLHTQPLPSASEQMCLPREKQNQPEGLNTSREAMRLLLLNSSLLSLVLSYQLAVKGEWTQALGSLRVPVAGSQWLTLQASLSCLSDRDDTQTSSSHGGEATIHFKLVERPLRKFIGVRLFFTWKTKWNRKIMAFWSWT